MGKYEGHTPEKLRAYPAQPKGYRVVEMGGHREIAVGIVLQADAELFADAPKFLAQRDRLLGLLKEVYCERCDDTGKIGYVTALGYVAGLTECTSCQDRRAAIKECEE